MTKIFINGLGRIGRQLLRLHQAQPQYYKAFEIVGVHDLMSPELAVHLLQYDSVYGRMLDLQHQELGAKCDKNNLYLGDLQIPYYQNLSAEELHKITSSQQVDYFLECTGRYKNKAEIAKISQTVTIVSAPMPDSDHTIVLGVNQDKIPQVLIKNTVISNASCTTNCLAPILQMLDQNFTLNSAFATTVHAVTNDQNLVDAPHSDLLRARSGMENIIPTTTGAKATIAQVLPNLVGKIDGVSLRVPVSTVSFLEVIATVAQKPTIAELTMAIQEYSQHIATINPNILKINHNKLVSNDFKNQKYSCIIDEYSISITGDLIRIGAWYDNEVGFAFRMLDLLLWIKKEEK